MSQPMLEAKNISVRFASGRGTVTAVDEVSLFVFPGEAVGLVGESGSGKTTLARVLVGLQCPFGGQVLLEGSRIIAAGSKEAFPRTERWKIQMVFQDPYSSLNPRMRACDAVAEALHVSRGMTRRQARRDALDLLGSVGITGDLGWQLPRFLSGGQRQRVSVARALAPGPRLLVADEPTSALDQSVQAQLLNLLRRLQTERNLAILFVSHDLNLVRYLTSRVYVMQAGRIVEAGDSRAVLEAPQHPYTQQLIDSIPGRSRRSGLLT